MFDLDDGDPSKPALGYNPPVEREWMERARDAGACTESQLWLARGRSWNELIRERPGWVLLAARMVPGLAEKVGAEALRKCEDADPRMAIVCLRLDRLNLSYPAMRRLFRSGSAGAEEVARMLGMDASPPDATESE